MRIEDLRGDMRVLLCRTAESCIGDRFGTVFATPGTPYRLNDTVLVRGDRSGRHHPIRPDEILKEIKP